VATNQTSPEFMRASKNVAQNSKCHSRLLNWQVREIITKIVKSVMLRSQLNSRFFFEKYNFRNFHFYAIFQKNPEFYAFVVVRCHLVPIFVVCFVHFSEI
jgi:hypothetical protein